MLCQAFSFFCSFVCFGFLTYCIITRSCFWQVCRIELDTLRYPKLLSSYIVVYGFLCVFVVFTIICLWFFVLIFSRRWRRCRKDIECLMSFFLFFSFFFFLFCHFVFFFPSLLTLRDSNWFVFRVSCVCVCVFLSSILSTFFLLIFFCQMATLSIVVSCVFSVFFNLILSWFLCVAFFLLILFPPQVATLIPTPTVYPSTNIVYLATSPHLKINGTNFNEKSTALYFSPPLKEGTDVSIFVSGICSYCCSIKGCI